MKFISKAKKLIQYLIEASNRYEIRRLAAALSYYSVFAFAPLLVLVLKLLSPLLKSKTIEEILVNQGSLVLGDELAESYLANIDKLNRFLDFDGVYAVIAFLIAIVAGLSYFDELKNAINSIFDIKRKREITARIKNILFGFLAVIVLALLLVVFILFDAVAQYIDFLLIFSRSFYITVIRVLSVIVNVGLLTIAFGLAFKFLPDVKLSIKSVVRGGFVTAVLFIIGQLALSLYINDYLRTENFALSASLIVFMLWIFYCAIIFLMGTLITRYLEFGPVEDISLLTKSDDKD